MHINAERLREKGWSEDEIAQTQKILTKVRRRKHPHQHLLNEITFWALLLLSSLTMVAVAYWVLPLFVFSNQSILYPVLIIIGVSLGLLINHVLQDLEHLKLHHHILITGTLPIISIISFLSILGHIEDVTIPGVTEKALFSSILFIISFLLPYLYQLTRKK